MNNIETLTEEISTRFLAATRAEPVTWSQLVDELVDNGHKHDRSDLVAVVNLFLVPVGPIRGSYKGFWFEPLPEDWRAIPAPEKV